MKNFLITGGCGFLGVSLIKRLLGEGSTNIRVIDNLSIGTRDDLNHICNFKEIDPLKIIGLPEGVELIVGDILDYDKITTLLKSNVDYVYNFASIADIKEAEEIAGDVIDVNIKGHLKLMQVSNIYVY